MMNCKRLLGLVSLFLAAALAASCSDPAKLSSASSTWVPPVIVSLDPSLTPSARLSSSPSVSPFPSLSPSVESVPYPTETPSPVGLQHPLPSALPSPAPAQAGAALAASNYYVVSKNGRKCVVDGNGKMILQPIFAEIEDVSHYIVRDDGNEDAILAGEALFFATPAQVGPAKAKRRYSGYLYNAKGKLVTSVRLSEAVTLSPELIEIKKAQYGDYVTEDYDPGDTGDDSGDTYGAILYSGRLIIPYQYLDINQFGSTVAAVKTGTPTTETVDFYDLKGKLLGSMTAGFNSQNSSIDVFPCGSFLVMSAPGGKYGILDDKLHWLAQPVWDDIQYNDLTGQFVMIKGGMAGVMDSTGKFVIPQTYRAVGINEDGNMYSPYTFIVDRFYFLTDTDGLCLLDSKGNVLLRLKGHRSVSYSQGVLIVQHSLETYSDTDSSDTPTRSDIYDLQGNFLLSIPDTISEYDPEHRLFSNGNYSKFYDSNGIALPLPGESAECVTADRFIVMQGVIVTEYGSTQAYGLCDAKGKWIMQPKYTSLKSIGGNALLYGVEYDKSEEGEMYGIADLDGHVLTSPVFYSFYDESIGLYYVETATMSGLMDADLNWVWKTTIYDELMD